MHSKRTKIKMRIKKQAIKLQSRRGETLVESILSLLLLSLAVLMVSTMMAAVMRMNRETHETRALLNETLAKIDANELPQDVQSFEAACSLTLTLRNQNLGTNEEVEGIFSPVSFDILEGLVADIRPGVH